MLRAAFQLHVCLLALAAVALAWPAPADVAAPLIGFERPAARVWLDAGWDPTFVTSAGISTRILRADGAGSLDLDTVIAAPLVLLPEGDSFRVASGVTASSTPDRAGFGISLGLHPDLRSSSDSVAHLIALGLTAGMRPGYYGRRSTLALDLAWSAAVVTHVAPRAPVHALFRDRYPGESAGPPAKFYMLTSQRFRFGVAGGMAFTRALAAHSELGFSWTPQLTGLVNPPYGPLPFYGSLGGAFRW